MAVTEFDPPERFVVGTVGPPGERQFFLQARSGTRVSSVSLEKQQVSILAERMVELLESMPGTSGTPVGEPDLAPLDTPIEDDFRVMALTLAWDPSREVVVIECHDGDPDEGVTEALRVVLPPPDAAAFARRARDVISAGRPPCPFCGGPLEADGHICPRANGYRR